MNTSIIDSEFVLGRAKALGITSITALAAVLTEHRAADGRNKIGRSQLSKYLGGTMEAPARLARDLATVLHCAPCAVLGMKLAWHHVDWAVTDK